MEEEIRLKRDENGRFIPGGPGGPGRPKGKTMKEFAREYLMLKTDEEKQEWLDKRVNPIDVWKMAEGMPKQDMDVTTDGQPMIIRLNE